MIPHIHLVNFLSCLFCCLSARKLYFSYKKTYSEDIADFLKTFIALSILFLFTSVPAILANPVIIQIIYVLSYIPVILAPAFLLKAAIRVSGYPVSWSKFIFYFIFCLVIIITILNFVFFSPAEIQAYGRFYHWLDKTPFWLATLSGLLIGGLAVTCALLFFLGGVKSKTKLVRVRSFIIAAGIVILVAATFINYLFPVTDPKLMKGWWTLPGFASFFALLGLVVILAGIYYKEKEKSRGL